VWPHAIRYFSILLASSCNSAHALHHLNGHYVSCHKFLQSSIARSSLSLSLRTSLSPGISNSYPYQAFSVFDLVSICTLLPALLRACRRHFIKPNIASIVAISIYYHYICMHCRFRISSSYRTLSHPDTQIPASSDLSDFKYISAH